MITPYIGHSDCVALLRKRGASLDVKDARGFLPAHCAATMAHNDIATALGVGNPPPPCH
jgi:ankyrin repeat protein